MYKVRFTNTAAKAIKKLPPKIITRLINKVESLSKNPRPVNAKKLKGKKDELWRIRVGDYRIVYFIYDEIKIVKVTKIGHRKDIYR